MTIVWSSSSSSPAAVAIELFEGDCTLTAGTLGPELTFDVIVTAGTGGLGVLLLLADEFAAAAAAAFCSAIRLATTSGTRLPPIVVPLELAAEAGGLAGCLVASLTDGILTGCGAGRVEVVVVREEEGRFCNVEDEVMPLRDLASACLTSLSSSLRASFKASISSSSRRISASSVARSSSAEASIVKALVEALG